MSYFYRDKLVCKNGCSYKALDAAVEDTVPYTVAGVNEVSFCRDEQIVSKERYLFYSRRWFISQSTPEF